MSGQGLLRKEYVTEVGNKQYVESITTVFFEEHSLSEYNELFNRLLENGLIADGTFEHNKWPIYYSGKKKSYFHFDVDKYPFLNVALKCFCLLALDSGLNPPNLNAKLRHLKDVIVSSNGFSGSSSEEHLDAWLSGKSENVLMKIVPTIAQFISFIGHENESELTSICENYYPGILNNVRELPSFMDVLEFDTLLSDFIDTWSDTDKIVYYPIVLWWRITLVIPMRIGEFCKLGFNCTYEQGGKYYLRVPRIKRKAKTSREIDIINELLINKQIYDVIIDYKSITSPFKENPYLLSWEAYRQSERARSNKNAEYSKANKDLFEVQQFYKLLQNFYSEIVQKKYGYHHLQKLRPMDTRHYAFCNMMLQGFNMLTIARIGGHFRIQSQMHYFQHLDHLNESAIQYLSEKYKKKAHITMSQLNPMMSGIETSLRAKSILRPLSEEQLSSLARLEHGYCLFDPSKCPVGDCRHCEHLYLPESELSPAVYSWLSDESEKLASLLKEQLELMRKLTENMNYNFVTMEYDQLTQAEMSYLAMNSKNLREQKARTDAHRDLVREYLLGGQND